VASHYDLVYDVNQKIKKVLDQEGFKNYVKEIKMT
jgi:hypothetical protein